MDINYCTEYHPTSPFDQQAEVADGSPKIFAFCKANCYPVSVGRWTCSDKGFKRLSACPLPLAFLSWIAVLSAGALAGTWGHRVITFNSPQKFREFLEGSNLISKLQAKHDLLKRTLGEGTVTIPLLLYPRFCVEYLLLILNSQCQIHFHQSVLPSSRQNEDVLALISVKQAA